jgi:hypothetical protein
MPSLASLWIISGDGRYRTAYSKGVPKFSASGFEKTGEFTAHPQSGASPAEHLVINVIDARTKVFIDINDPIRDDDAKRSKINMAHLCWLDDDMIGTFTHFSAGSFGHSPQKSQNGYHIYGPKVSSRPNARTK